MLNRVRSILVPVESIVFLLPLFRVILGVTNRIKDLLRGTIAEVVGQLEDLTVMAIHRLIHLFRARVPVDAMITRVLFQGGVQGLQILLLLLFFLALGTPEVSECIEVH